MRRPAAALCLALAACAPSPPVLCNGAESSCGRRYDELTIAATHNAFAYAGGGPRSYAYPNQDAPVTDQLAAGIRGFGLRPSPYFGDDASQRDVVYQSHNSDLRGALGQAPFVEVLAELRAFLDANPREVITVFSEADVELARVAATVAEAGLLPYLYTPAAPSAPWPTLAGMIDAGTRLVWFETASVADAPPWMLAMWDEVVDTDYNVTDPGRFRCDYHRGRGANRLYFLNHFVYAELGGGVLVPDRDKAAAANEPTFLEARARACEAAMGRRVNVVYVDFFGQGDVSGAVRALNGG
jgi:hypothetical protein